MRLVPVFKVSLGDNRSRAISPQGESHDLERVIGEGRQKGMKRGRYASLTLWGDKGPPPCIDIVRRTLISGTMLFCQNGTTRLTVSLRHSVFGISFLSTFCRQPNTTDSGQLNSKPRPLPSQTVQCCGLVIWISPQLCPTFNNMMPKSLAVSSKSFINHNSR